MGQVLNGCARTTEAVRRAIQHSQTSLNALAAQYGINPKTVAKAPECPGFAHGAEAGTVVRANTRRGSGSRGVSPLYALALG